MIVLAKSSEHGVRNPCEGCTGQTKISIIMENSTHDDGSDDDDDDDDDDDAFSTLNSF